MRAVCVKQNWFIDCGESIQWALHRFELSEAAQVRSPAHRNSCRNSIFTGLVRGVGFKLELSSQRHDAVCLLLVRNSIRCKPYHSVITFVNFATLVIQGIWGSAGVGLPGRVCRREARDRRYSGYAVETPGELNEHAKVHSALFHIFVFKHASSCPTHSGYT